ncbi:cyclase [Pedobacter sp. PLR]|uniref:SRPBCC family protein n=1 Tax=Pedobacter sp. PLR TaxID=2994465 RepID=UPI0022472BC5|nr:SRPBCC family protein [Pedobacter sp. PLR]MCX2451836.1 cyclase [Pedobacter sp. PLR]
MSTPLKLRSGRFSIEKHQYENIGWSERMVSMFLSGALISWGLRKPSKSKFLYGAYMAYRAATGRCLFYEQLGIDARRPRAVNIRGEFIIDKPAHEVFLYWRNLNNLPGSIQHLLDVKVIDENLSTWKSNVIGNLFSVNWDAEIVKEEPGRLIGWKSAAGSLLHHVGRVEFTPSEDGKETFLKVVLSYRPVGGGLGIGLSKLMNPYLESLLKKEMKNFKHTIEHKTPVYT